MTYFYYTNISTWFYSIISFLTFTFTFIFFHYLILKFTTKNISNTTQKLPSPPSPPCLPIIGHLHLLTPVVPKCFQNLARRYGPLLRLRLGSSNMLLVSNSQIAMQIFKTHEINFSNRPEFGSSHYYQYRDSKFFTAPYGPYWRFMKKLCVTHLLSASQIARFTHVREEEMKMMLSDLMVCSREGRACDLSLRFSALTNNIICRMAMSVTCDAQEIQGLVPEFLEVAGKIILGEVLGPFRKLDLFGFGRRLAKVVSRFDVIVERIMKEHEEQPRCGDDGERRDMMDILLQVYRDPDAQIRLTRNDMKLFFLEIFLAGTDTTSMVLQWTMIEIINHPQVLKKLREELNRVVGRERLVKESDVGKLIYLQAVVKEVLRLHPPATITIRQPAEDCEINGYHIKSGTRTMVNIYAIMRDPETWEKPEEFIPERFIMLMHMEDNNMMMNDLNLKYFPFGSGRRACPGSSLALPVLHVTIAALIQCFDWKAEGGRDRIEAEEGSGITMGLTKPLVCYPITRALNLV